MSMWALWRVPGPSRALLVLLALLARSSSKHPRHTSRPPPSLSVASHMRNRAPSPLQEKSAIIEAKNSVSSGKIKYKRADGNKNNRRIILTKKLYVGGHVRAHAERCGGRGEGVRVVVLVASARAHRAQREAVRRSWGHLASRSDVAMAFIIGQPADTEKNKHIGASLEQEDDLYGDLVVGGWVDSYANLTLKTLSMLEWAHTYCPLARTLLKTDDDTFINVPILQHFVNKKLYANNTVFGNVMAERPSGVCAEELGYRRLPACPQGFAYLVTRDLIPRLLRAAPRLPYISHEDRFMGILVKSIGAKLVHAPEFNIYKASRAVAVMNVTPCKQLELWIIFSEHLTKCKIKFEIC